MPKCTQLCICAIFQIAQTALQASRPGLTNDIASLPLHSVIEILRSAGEHKAELAALCAEKAGLEVRLRLQRPVTSPD